MKHVQARISNGGLGASKFTSPERQKSGNEKAIGGVGRGQAEPHQACKQQLNQGEWRPKLRLPACVDEVSFSPPRTEKNAGELPATSPSHVHQI
ncbi:hypothetical protein C0Q70_12898 [Pomacea canaliculata]|uniref:Uncharacterized protein n=1 Tax=Pomacea canaliculata TaxID=400727 RepID=A0A2T7P2T3_POMCA|nr:hypothetical protein C0Q70_12898 [Pomacea canaliculata]